MTSKICCRCKCAKSPDDFSRSAGNADGKQTTCRLCQIEVQRAYRAKNKLKHAAPQEPDLDITVVEDAPAVDPVEQKAEARFAAAQARLESEYEPLKPGDLGTKDDYRAPNYDREKKQEFNAKMGEFMDFARGKDGDVDELAKYVSLLVTQEGKWMNKRQARIHSLTHAREMLLARRFEILAKALEWPRTFGTYTPRTKNAPARRTITGVLSDLHGGARMPADENPIAFDMQAFNRRLAYVVREFCDYKTQYRDQTDLNLLYLGDGMEGNLLHSTQFDQDPTPVQLVALARALYCVAVYAAAHFKTVTFHLIGGNHGRDKLMHQGRALASRQYNFERAVALMVADRCSHLPNISFHVPKAAVIHVQLFDKHLLALHGDAEAKLKAPSSSGGHASWQAAIDKFSAEKLWAPQCDALLSGHFHDPALMPFDTGTGISNGMLIPPGGYGRAGGYRGPCGQWMFESVPGHAVGDSRYVRVGVEQDKDASLDEIIPTFTW